MSSGRCRERGVDLRGAGTPDEAARNREPDAPGSNSCESFVSLASSRRRLRDPVLGHDLLRDAGRQPHPRGRGGAGHRGVRVFGLYSAMDWLINKLPERLRKPCVPSSSSVRRSSPRRVPAVPGDHDQSSASATPTARGSWHRQLRRHLHRPRTLERSSQLGRVGDHRAGAWLLRSAWRSPCSPTSSAQGRRRSPSRSSSCRWPSRSSARRSCGASSTTSGRRASASRSAC